MSTQSFKVKSGLTISPVDLTTLTNPQAGDLACDINDSNKIKRYDAASASWTEVGSGAAGDVDTLLVQDFDSASLSSFTQTGLALVTTNQLDGRQSARLIHQPLVGAIQSFKETFSVSPKYRGVNMTASLLLRSSASQGNVTIQFRDETNSVDYPSQQLQTNSQEIASLVTNSTTLVSGFSNSVINSLKVGMSVTGSGIPTGTVISSINSTALTITLSQAATASATVSLRFSDLPRTIQLGFQIPANCSSYSYTISALQESGSPETYIDDIVLKNYWLGMSNQGQSTINVQTVTTQTTAIQQTANFTNSIITGSASSTSGSNIYIYNSTNGTYTFLVDAIVDANLSLRTSAGAFVQAEIRIDSNIVAISLSQNSVGYWATTAFTGRVNAGQVVTFLNNSATTSDQQRISLAAQAITTSQVTTTDLVPAKAVLGNTSLEIPSITGWQGYTPTFQGFGTPTNIEFEWRQVGENVEIRGKFTAGTSTAVEARIGLPAGLTSAGTSLIPSIQLAGNATYNFSSAVSVYTLMEPSVNYITFGWQNASNGGLNKLNGNTVLASGNNLSLFASVPCAGLSATEEVVVSGTQSALVQEADSAIRVSSLNGYGSTATRIRRFSTINENFGSDILYQDSAINGSSFTVLTSGIYNISYDDGFTTATYIGISKNATSLSTSISALSNNERIALSYQDAINNPCSISCTVYLNAGDVIRPHTDGGTTVLAAFGQFKITKQGSLKQLNVSSDQKITIPTSELRFEGASARGSTATAIVRFDTLAKLRGNAFSVVSDAVNGTAITMLKAGKLDVSASIRSTTSAAVIGISKNQVVLTTTATPSESLIVGVKNNTGTDALPLSTSTFVNAGDVIRVFSDTALTAMTVASFNLSFQEQDISVSVSNTLPQFSESDSSVRLQGANGYGSIATNTRRFASVLHNIGNAINYVDDPSLGAQFIAREAGIYNVSYSENSTVNTANSAIYINVNGSLVAFDNQVYNTVSAAGKYASASWSGYLNAGDIVTAVAEVAANNNGTTCLFTISKVGKPNVTGVDVTPFVNVPQPDIAYYTAYNSPNGFGSTYTQTPRFLSVQRNDGTGILSYTDSATLGGFWTANKNCKVDINLSGVYLASAAYSLSVYKNQTGVSIGTVLALEEGATNLRNGISTTVNLVAGDTIRFYYSSTSMNRTAEFVSITAEALSDQILTAPETFSTDTAALKYIAGTTDVATTLANLANQPVGTYTTFTYAAGSNTRSHTITRPTQADADMNTNGMLIYSRAYNVLSTAAQPSMIAIQIGKGLKGRSIDGYGGVAKTIPCSYDYIRIGNDTELGTLISYSEITGILTIDAGSANTSLNTSRSALRDSNIANYVNGYFVINASKNPALTGLGLGTVAARGVSTSGQSIPSAVETTMLYDAVKTYDTHGALNTATGIFTAPESGYYQASWSCLFSFTANLGQVIYAGLFKNNVMFSNGAYNTMDRAVAIDAGSTGSCGVYLAKGDTVQIKLFNNRAAGATSLNVTASSNYFSIHKTSIGTGN